LLRKFSSLKIFVACSSLIWIAKKVDSKLMDICSVNFKFSSVLFERPIWSDRLSCKSLDLNETLNLSVPNRWCQLWACRIKWTKKLLHKKSLMWFGCVGNIFYVCCDLFIYSVFNSSCNTISVFCDPPTTIDAISGPKRTQ